MPEPADTYTPADQRERFHDQAIRVWIITTIVVLAWVASIVAAPLMDTPAIYAFFSYICHQLPDRSFHLDGQPMAVCSRCIGVYAGLLVGTAVYPIWRPVEESEPISRLWLCLAVIPIAIDWSLTVFGIWENTHATRFITGLILGAACATFIMPALVDITKNLTSRRLQGK